MHPFLSSIQALGRWEFANSIGTLEGLNNSQNVNDEGCKSRHVPVMLICYSTTGLLFNEVTKWFPMHLLDCKIHQFNFFQWSNNQMGRAYQNRKCPWPKRLMPRQRSTVNMAVKYMYALKRGEAIRMEI